MWQWIVTLLGILTIMVHQSWATEMLNEGDEASTYDDLLNRIRVFDVPMPARLTRLAPRRGDPFAFGLGKRADPFAFGLGKRSAYVRDTEKRDPYAFGLGR